MKNGTSEPEEYIPLPPTRTSSVSEEAYRKLIIGMAWQVCHLKLIKTLLLMVFRRHLANRPLPPVPDSSSSSEDSSEYSEDDEDDETSTSYGLLDHINPTNSVTDERKSSISEVENICEDSRRASEASLDSKHVSRDSESNSPSHRSDYMAYYCLHIIRLSIFFETNESVHNISRCSILSN